MEYFSEKNEINDPIVFSYSNDTGEEKTVCMFETFNKNNPGVSVTNLQGAGIDSSFFKRFFYDKPHLTKSIRIHCKNRDQLERVFSEIKKTPSGRTMISPRFVPVMENDPDQFQMEIIDRDFFIIMDSISSDIEFKLLPNATVTISVWFNFAADARMLGVLNTMKEKQKELSLNHEPLKMFRCLSLENLSDYVKEVDINNPEEFLSKHIIDKELKIFNVLRDHEKVLKEYDFPVDYVTGVVKNIKMYYASTVLSRTESNMKNQLTSPIKFKLGQTYHNKEELRNPIISISDLLEPFSQKNGVIIRIFPKTKIIVMLSGTYKNDMTPEEIEKIINA